jgi:hypothetical protein
MNLRVALYDTLVNNSLLVRVLDLDNEGGKAKVVVIVSGHQPPLEIEVDRITVSPIDVFIPDTPITSKIHEITAKIYSSDQIQIHDTDIKMIKLGK